jgi:Na+/H+ antiporter NhaD/arsenite permease-like protein
LYLRVRRRYIIITGRPNSNLLSRCLNTASQKYQGRAAERLFQQHTSASTCLAMRSIQVALVAVLSVEATLAFTNPQTTATCWLRSGQSLSSNGRLTSTTKRHVTASTEDFNPQGLVPLKKETMITPEGYGFTAPAKRILSAANRKGSGYYRASSTENIMSVINAITTGDDFDAALVFDTETDKIVGLFTESDYIKVCTFCLLVASKYCPAVFVQGDRIETGRETSFKNFLTLCQPKCYCQFSRARAEQAKDEEQAANFLVSDVKDFVTPASELLSISVDDTANVAISAMKASGVRHLIVADKVTGDKKLQEKSIIEGVISMQDVMSTIHNDERLSMTTLARKYPGLNPVEQMRAELRSAANEGANNPETARGDILGFGASILGLVATAAFFSQSLWLHDHASAVIIAIFVLGYIGIIFEEVFEFNKAAVALLMSTGMWITYADFFNSDGSASAEVIQQLGEQLADVSDICFFLLAASAIVEVVDLHEGFKVVTSQIKTTSKKQLFWTIGFLTFFLSAILNNLTVTIVLCSLLRKLVPVEEERKMFGAMVVVAANAGGVWTPIGDVTTTMLWINNQLSTVPTVLELFLPSVVCLVGSLAFLVRQIEDDDSLEGSSLPEQTPLAPRGKLVFWAGIACLLSVPIFAELTGLPPYLAMLTGLGAIWVLTDVIHMRDKDDDGLQVPDALARLDTSGILFFLGILMSIGVLDKSGLLKDLAVLLSDNLPSLDIIATVIGLASALIDNVPLVAATMGMYDLSEYGTDDRLWQLIALCAGTGGSILVIGSASGVALMGLEKVDFLWYTKKVSLGATVGYFAGIATYIAQSAILHGGLNLLPQAAVAMDMAQQSAGSFGM